MGLGFYCMYHCISVAGIFADVARFSEGRRLTTHWNGRAISQSLINQMACAPFNSSVRRLPLAKGVKMRFVLVICICVILLSTGKIDECLSSNSFENDNGIHNRLVIIKGKVIELNNLDLGETPANTNFSLIFQKD